MTPQIFVLLFATLFFQINSSSLKSPRDLVDEARQELEDLRAIVQGKIFEAQSIISGIENAFRINSYNVFQNGVMLVQHQRQTINADLTVVKELANGADISSCTDVREELLDRMPSEYMDKLNGCIAAINEEHGVLLVNVNYVIDISINKVHNLEFQLKQCKEDLLCISPLITEINLDKISIPQAIDILASTFESTVNNLMLIVQTCSDTTVAEYAAESSSILQDITECVNGIIG